MKKIIIALSVVLLFGLNAGPSYAFTLDRNLIVIYARYMPDPDCCVKFNADNQGIPPRANTVPNQPTAAYQQISKAINQIDLLKQQIKNLSAGIK